MPLQSAVLIPLLVLYVTAAVCQVTFDTDEDQNRLQNGLVLTTASRGDLTSNIVVVPFYVPRGKSVQRFASGKTSSTVGLTVQLIDYDLAGARVSVSRRLSQFVVRRRFAREKAFGLVSYHLAGNSSASGSAETTEDEE